MVAAAGRGGGHGGDKRGENLRTKVSRGGKVRCQGENHQDLSEEVSQRKEGCQKREAIDQLIRSGGTT